MKSGSRLEGSWVDQQCGFQQRRHVLNNQQPGSVTKMVPNHIIKYVPLLIAGSIKMRPCQKLR